VLPSVSPNAALAQLFDEFDGKANLSQSATDYAEKNEPTSLACIKVVASWLRAVGCGMAV
jgi:hypothetical protein